MQGLELWRFDSYQTYIKAYLQSLPKSGRGASVKISNAVGVHSTLFSQIIRGHRDFSIEQAATFCDYLGFSDDECDLFLRMVELNRAGNESLRKKLRRQITEIKDRFQQIKSRVKTRHKLSEAEKAIFYSTWQYTAIRMLISLERQVSTEEISRLLNIPLGRTREVIEFLIQTGLVLNEKGLLKMGPSITHIESQSFWSKRHHLNWRTKHLGRIETLSNEELCFTAPFSCSKKDYKLIKEKILSLIQEISETVKDSPAEEPHTICIDLFNLAT